MARVLVAALVPDGLEAAIKPSEWGRLEAVVLEFVQQVVDVGAVRDSGGVGVVNASGRKAGGRCGVSGRKNTMKGRSTMTYQSTSTGAHDAKARCGKARQPERTVTGNHDATARHVIVIARCCSTMTSKAQQLGSTTMRQSMPTLQSTKAQGEARRRGRQHGGETAEIQE